MDFDAAAFSLAPGFGASGVVAIVDRNPRERDETRLVLAAAGYRTAEFDDGRSLCEGAGETTAVVCLRLAFGQAFGFDFLQKCKRHDPSVPVIVLVESHGLAAAMEATRSEAYDYVTMPLERERLVLAVRRACERQALLHQVTHLKRELGQREAVESIVGQSPPMRELARQVERVLGSEGPVCLCGEGGTGKEVVARAIHAAGSRRDGPFVVFNCATVAASLQETELFGHEHEPYRDSAAAQRGRLLEAAGGMLFIDKLAELAPGAQARLAEVLRTGSMRRFGGAAQPLPLDFRIVSATRRDLAAEVEAGRFNQELFALLAERPIRLAPLRERAEDVPLLVAHFIHAAGKGAVCQVNRVSPDALDALARYNWPGNVSELLNVIHRALLACRGDEITLADLPPTIRKLAVPSVRPAPSEPLLSDGFGNDATTVLSLRELERRAIKAALRTTGGSVGKAARLLGIGRATLYRRLADKEFARPSGAPEPKVAGAGGRGEL